MSDAPYIIDADFLASRLNDASIKVVDMSQSSSYLSHHIPGAVNIDYGQIVWQQKPIMGIKPNTEHLEQLLGQHGLSHDDHIISYDDQGGGNAARFLWTLATLGHQKWSLLDGGMHHWAANNLPLSNAPTSLPTCTYQANPTTEFEVDHKDVHGLINHAQFGLLDTRSTAEFDGSKRLATRGGHIPSAVNFDWVNALDLNNNLLCKPAEALHEHFNSMGITSDKTIVTYCHSHHRSSHTFVLLKHLGFEQVKGYAGSWSEWGNLPDTPIE
ncbi:MAG: sulfurtransferase [Methylococcales bacterium]|jgi:thiosulfate/3-mercaptopyruvate sulfurtransferase|nr:sulfurtransferase [Methylococcales bacterium]MBT7445861.1 sulfurtransferase [Methylococcales bacterium]